MSNIIDNPFTPTFGRIPLQLAGRTGVIDDIIGGLENRVGDPNRSTLFIGARGTGKTVLLAKIAKEASSIGWISVNVNAEEGLLGDILAQIRENAKKVLSKKIFSQITSINLGGIGVSRNIDKNAEKATWRSEMTDIIKELNTKSIGLLITVDEVNVNVDELRTLIITYQHFIREERDVALIMAGLPQKVSALLRNDSISFLRRAFQHYLSPIEDNEVRYSIKKTIELSGRSIEGEALSAAVSAAMGFPFMIQLIGYHMWRQHQDAETITTEDAIEGVQLARNDLEKMVFETTYCELSEKDISFLKAMLKDKEYSTMTDITKRMKVTTKYAGIYRKRLIEQGIIGSRGHGRVAFELPMFREYLQDRVM